MNPFDQQNVPDIIVYSVAFSNDAVEIEFLEEHDQSKYVKEVRRRLIDRSRFPEEIAHIERLLQELLDDADILRRDPPTKIRR